MQYLLEMSIISSQNRNWYETKFFLTPPLLITKASQYNYICYHFLERVTLISLQRAQLTLDSFYTEKWMAAQVLSDDSNCGYQCWVFYHVTDAIQALYVHCLSLIPMVIWSWTLILPLLYRRGKCWSKKIGNLSRDTWLSQIKDLKQIKAQMEFSNSAFCLTI